MLGSASERISLKAPETKGRYAQYCRQRRCVLYAIFFFFFTVFILFIYLGTNVLYPECKKDRRFSFQIFSRIFYFGLFQFNAGDSHTFARLSTYGRSRPTYKVFLFTPSTLISSRPRPVSCRVEELRRRVRMWKGAHKSNCRGAAANSSPPTRQPKNITRSLPSIYQRFINWLLRQFIYENKNLFATCRPSDPLVQPPPRRLYLSCINIHCRNNIYLYLPAEIPM